MNRVTRELYISIQSEKRFALLTCQGMAQTCHIIMKSSWKSTLTPESSKYALSHANKLVKNIKSKIKKCSSRIMCCRLTRVFLLIDAATGISDFDKTGIEMLQEYGKPYTVCYNLALRPVICNHNLN
jgi:hypothetical protein